MQNPMMIECKRVKKRFGDFLAVDDVSLELQSGICTLMGPNGAGKSTLLKVLTGLLAPDKGEIRVAGLDVSKQTIAVRSTMGVVPESLGLFDSFTIQEYLELCVPIYGLSKKQTRERAETLMRFFDLEQGRDTFLDRCSYGMRKENRIFISRGVTSRSVILSV